MTHPSSGKVITFEATDGTAAAIADDNTDLTEVDLEESLIISRSTIQCSNFPSGPVFAQDCKRWPAARNDIEKKKGEQAGQSTSCLLFWW